MKTGCTSIYFVFFNFLRQCFTVFTVQIDLLNSNPMSFLPQHHNSLWLMEKFQALNRSMRELFGRTWVCLVPSKSHHVSCP